MMSIYDYEDEIKDKIGEKRFLHTLRVKDIAVELSKIYGVDEKKAEIAGFLHDVAKFKNKELLYEYVRIYNLEMTEDLKKAPQIIHAHLGSEIALKKYNIKDKDICNAIKYHTTGRAGMSSLEKIIFLADYIEPNRNFSGVDEARKLAFKDLDKAMVFSLDNTIKFLIDENLYIAIDTIKARNYELELV